MSGSLKEEINNARSNLDNLLHKINHTKDHGYGIVLGLLQIYSLQCGFDNDEITECRMLFCDEMMKMM